MYIRKKERNKGFVTRTYDANTAKAGRESHQSGSPTNKTHIRTLTLLINKIITQKLTW